MAVLTWPNKWQAEAIAAIAPYVDVEERLEIVVGDPRTSIEGSVVAGYVYSGPDDMPWVIHDKSGRPDVYPWPMLLGPVLRIELLRPRHPRRVLYANPSWTPHR